MKTYINYDNTQLSQKLTITGLFSIVSGIARKFFGFVLFTGVLGLAYSFLISNATGFWATTSVVAAVGYVAAIAVNRLTARALRSLAVEAAERELITEELRDRIAVK
jgi:hypothetical protein